MSNSQRLKLVLQMMRDEFPNLLVGEAAVVDRRFELLQRENDIRNRNMREFIARSKDNP